MSSSSWLDIPEDSGFSLENIPFGVFSLPPQKDRPRGCTGIGSYVVDLSVLSEAGLFNDCPELSARAFDEAALNTFMACPRPVWVHVRNTLIKLFDGTDDRLASNKPLQAASMHPMEDVKLHLPVDVPDYTDFYSSRHHATNVGIMFRGKDNALQPNWLHLPVGYHGRSSTIFPSGTPIHRPRGQLQKDRDDPTQGSVYGECKLLDFELEMAVLVGGKCNSPGQALTMEEAYECVFGFCLMNDWSARDVQKWEYVPLGPFTAKNFATTVSPWIVTTMALEKYTSPPPTQDDPVPLEYLKDNRKGNFDVTLQVAIQGEGMDAPHVVCESNLSNLYWNATQQLVHHSVTGCVMRPGDMLGSGTLSGPTEDSLGSMLELSWKGSREVSLGGGETRKFLKNGDSVIIQGWAGGGKVGFGECAGKVLPPLDAPPPQPKKVDRYCNFKLYSYWRSSSTWRVRIALEAKSIPYEVIPINLKTGQQDSQDFHKTNPMAQVPTLEYTDTLLGRKVQISQSVAIMEFLDEAFPDRPALLPVDPMDRAKAREMCQVINSGTQPLQNLLLVKRLEKMSDGTINGMEFGRAAIEKGLQALEELVVGNSGNRGGPYALGGFSPSVVDACLVPQLYNGRIFKVDLEKVCPKLLEIEAVCLKHLWFGPSHPSAQPDAET